MSRPARVAGALLGLLIAIANCGSGARAQTEPLELAIKATYVYKFAAFVDWPNGTFASPSAPIIFCIVGSDAMSELLGQVVQDQKIDNRPLVVRRLSEPAATDAGCQVMFLAGQSPQSIREWLAAVRGKPVLTVTDSGAEGAKGIINFLIVDSRVRFEIDNEAALESRLDISSKLLSLATRVRPKQ